MRKCLEKQEQVLPVDFWFGICPHQLKRGPVGRRVVFENPALGSGSGVVRR